MGVVDVTGVADLAAARLGGGLGRAAAGLCGDGMMGLYELNLFA